MKEITAKEFKQEVLEGGKVAVDFYSSECPPCEALAPKFEGLAELYGDEIKFIKIFRQDNRELAESLDVNGSPTVIFYNDGELVGDKLSGGIKRSDMISNLNALLPEQKATEIKNKIKPRVSEYDTIILGGGPGGLTAGLYLCQAKVNAVLVDIMLPGGQVSTTHKVSNYPGFVDPQPGFMLAHYMSEQTKICGTKYKVAVDVTLVDLENKTIVVDEFETIKAKKIILATGASPRYIGVPGEKELKGNGISYCATCDAKYFHDKDVIVIGGGNSAIEEADFITKFAKKVTIIHQFDKLQANKEAQEKAFANPKIEFVFDTEPQGFEKNGNIVKIATKNMKTGETATLKADGVFIFVGMKPNTDLFGDTLETDDWGYIKTNEDMKTSIDGIYAVGDIRSKKYRQITTAVADGTIAAISITKELDS
ncbi:MAG: FAD-dependent oxidoreductase [Salinivirgaceae bacterium]|jgi:thioredoxin reductase (NADPH)|nr:FAD-dependent oxidoreductase [Salinivirgaceae bacterium]